MTISMPTEPKQPAPVAQRSPVSVRNGRSGLPVERSTASGFTLAEVMIAAVISTVVLAGVLTAFLMVGRSGYNASGYTTMDNEVRRGLELLSIDARMASDIAWSNNTSLTLTVNGAQVTYAFDSSTTGTTARSFYRKAGGPSSAATPDILVRDVTDFAFCYYKVVNGVDHTASGPLDTKQIQVTLRAARTRATVATATNSVLSARIVLRNKKVSA